MADQQEVSAYFNHAIPKDTTWILSDASGVQSSGVISASTSHIVMRVTKGLPLDHNYKLKLQDVAGVLLESVSFSHADGGIVIIDNLDIHRNPLTAKTMSTAVKTKR
jgi:hypothetical protein